MTHFWIVTLSYEHPKTDKYPRSYRDNARVGVVAETCELAMTLAKNIGVPAGCADGKIWSVSHHGEVHGVEKVEE
jgi:hypothetical protein